jgi:choice-of-anchor C domain-containing protein
VTRTRTDAIPIAILRKDSWRLAVNKRRSLLGMTGAVVALVALSGSVMAADVTNGGFEAGPFSDPGNLGYQELPAGSSQLGPWTITSGSVDWISTYWAPASGTKSIDLAGREPGTISQTVATTAGKTYVVSFMLAGNTDSANNPAGGPAVKTLSVAATGTASAPYTFDTTGKTPSHMGWTAKAYSFRATGPSTTITFTNTSAGYYGAALDQIEVAALTGDACKNSGWKTMLDSVGNSFKNQGDCVSFYATDGRNLGAIAN